MVAFPDQSTSNQTLTFVVSLPPYKRTGLRSLYIRMLTRLPTAEQPHSLFGNSRFNFKKVIFTDRVE